MTALAPLSLQAIVLAGGFGTRLQSMVRDVPKPMARVGNRPFLEIILERLDKQGIRSIILSVGYLHESIVSHFGKRFGNIDISYSIEEKPLGTGGAVGMAMARCDSERALVLNGDTFLNFDVREMEEVWLGTQHAAMACKYVDDASRFGRVITNSSGTLATGFSEKNFSGAGLINAGVYIFSKSLFAGRTPAASYSLESEILVPAAADGHLSILRTEGLFIDIGVPEDFLRAQHLDFLTGKLVAQ